MGSPGTTTVEKGRPSFRGAALKAVAGDDIANVGVVERNDSDNMKKATGLQADETADLSKDNVKAESKSNKQDPSGALVDKEGRASNSNPTASVAVIDDAEATATDESTEVEITTDFDQPKEEVDTDSNSAAMNSTNNDNGVENNYSHATAWTDDTEPVTSIANEVLKKDGITIAAAVDGKNIETGAKNNESTEGTASVNANEDVKKKDAAAVSALLDSKNNNTFLSKRAVTRTAEATDAGTEDGGTEPVKPDNEEATTGTAAPHAASEEAQSAGENGAEPEEDNDETAATDSASKEADERDAKPKEGEDQEPTAATATTDGASDETQPAEEDAKPKEGEDQEPTATDAASDEAKPAEAKDAKPEEVEDEPSATDAVSGEVQPAEEEGTEEKDDEPTATDAASEEAQTTEKGGETEEGENEENMDGTDVTSEESQAAQGKGTEGKDEESTVETDAASEKAETAEGEENTLDHVVEPEEGEDGTEKSAEELADGLESYKESNGTVANKVLALDGNGSSTVSVTLNDTSKAVNSTITIVVDTDTNTTKTINTFDQTTLISTSAVEGSNVNKNVSKATIVQEDDAQSGSNVENSGMVPGVESDTKENSNGKGLVSQVQGGTNQEGATLRDHPDKSTLENNKLVNTTLDYQPAVDNMTIPAGEANNAQNIADSTLGSDGTANVTELNGHPKNPVPESNDEGAGITDLDVATKNVTAINFTDGSIESLGKIGATTVEDESSDMDNVEKDGGTDGGGDGYDGTVALSAGDDDTFTQGTSNAEATEAATDAATEQSDWGQQPGAESGAENAYNAYAPSYQQASFNQQPSPMAVSAPHTDDSWYDDSDGGLGLPILLLIMGVVLTVVFKGRSKRKHSYGGYRQLPSHTGANTSKWN